MRKSAKRCARSSPAPCKAKPVPPRCDRPRCKRVCCVRKRKPGGRASRFCETVYPDIHTSDHYRPLPAQDTSNKTVYSYAIVNQGDHPVSVRVEVGPNKANYALDQEGVVGGGATSVVVPAKFMRYSRLTVKSHEKGKPTRLQIYFQAQSIR
jgi:hypothetical protein